MQPEIDVLGLPVKTFGLMFALGFLASGAVIHRRMRETGKPADWAYEMIFAALAGGLVGSRLFWIIENPDEVQGIGDVFGTTGLVWYGGVIGGAIFVLTWARWRGWLDATTFDMAAVPLALGNAIGRIGCQLAGDGDYGRAWDGPWAMGYPNGTVPTDPGETVHPTPIYETLAMGLIAWLLWNLRDRVRPGVLFALWLVLAGLARFLVEFVRRNDAVALGLTVPQWQSVAMMVGGVVWIAVVRRRHGSALLPSGEAYPGRVAAAA
ncbi:MAG: prolipoprotein diacylglyceryl transferase [Solirubrobacteraceae bacterium]|nr:prolipoprotein diacylglyceryl transferase [Solirubrobacteraceae bacterium]